jgi:putative DNA primase/helicase
MSAIPVESPKDAARRLSARALSAGFQPVALHEYRNANDEPEFWRIRLKHPETGEKWVRPMQWTAEGFALSEPEAPATGKLLYRLPHLLADTEAPVWVVEGENCADALTKAGKVATTSGSASSADGADWTPLHGRRVILWPDNDKPGAQYADNVETRLRALGCVVERVEVAVLGLPVHGDAVDWLRDNQREELDALPMVHGSTAHESDDGPRVILLRGCDVTPEPIDWLWHGWLAAGKMHLIGGQPGTGKTTIATALAATVSTGGRWPDGSRAARGSVVIWSGEDDVADTLIPRLRAAGADMQRVYLLGGIKAKGERYPFDPATDTALLANALADVPDVRLLVVDPIVSAVAGDSHKNAEVRRGLQPLVDLAQQHRCALLGVTHFTKGTAGREPVERITGSLAFGALARLVMVAAKQEADGDRPARRVLLRAKSNIGPDGGGFVYDLTQGPLPDNPAIESSRAVWGEGVKGTARELLAEAEAHDDDARDDAPGFLRELLGYGPRPAKDIYREAESAGFSRDAMKRAKRRVGAVAVKSGMLGGWEWRLPKDEGSEESAQNYPHPSLPSGGSAHPSGTLDGVEVWEL